MRELVRDLIRCPACRAPLGDREAGGLGCASGHVYPSRNGIPILLADESAASDAAAGVDSCEGAFSWATAHWEDLGLGKLLGPAPHAGATLLNFGCASADERKLEENVGWQAVSFDIHATEGTDLVADGHQLPFADGSFDAVTSFEVLEHLRAPWIAAEQIARVLRPGGRFVGSVAFLKPFHDSFFHMTHLGVVALLEPVGLRVDSVRGGQSPFVHVIGNFVPVGRALTTRVLNGAHGALAWARRSFWAVKHRKDPSEPSDRFEPRFQSSFDEFQWLQFGSTVIFSATKT